MVAGVEGFEPPNGGFGDRYLTPFGTAWLHPCVGYFSFSCSLDFGGWLWDIKKDPPFREGLFIVPWGKAYVYVNPTQ